VEVEVEEQQELFLITDLLVQVGEHLVLVVYYLHQVEELVEVGKQTVKVELQLVLLEEVELV
jgi:hypothetical protein